MLVTFRTIRLALAAEWKDRGVLVVMPDVVMDGSDQIANCGRFRAAEEA
jgi:hypothetical protein